MRLAVVTGANSAVLRQVATAVEVDAETAKLAENMIETMHAERGVGLAAPQVGVSARLIICLLGPEDGPETVMANPVITQKSVETEVGEEGCLSLPGVLLPIERHAHIEVEWRDANGKAKKAKLSGFAARVVQHEVDHLDGILITDRAQR